MASAAVVSISMGVMKPVLAKLATLMGDEYKKLKGLRKEVAFLQSELREMDALLERIDLADELDPQAKIWRKDIIEMSYDIEDQIDDFMCRVGEEANTKMGILRKASHYIRTFKDRHRLTNQLQEIKTQVMEASERRKRYMLNPVIGVSGTTPVVVDPRLSALYKESASLVGIETQKDEIVKWVMDETQQSKVMAIIGLGGLGKTTLANEVYRKVEGQFDHKAFVSVSQKPEMIGLFNSLLSQLGLVTCSHACQVQDPINKLRGYLRDKRYFIVVDDLWDTHAWNTICCAFPQDCQHSRVVITTRIESVARACCGNHGFIHTMKPLSEVDSRKLFFQRIIGSNDACPSKLMEASDTILKKCGGLPLAIITMASMLACQPTRLEGQWEYIQNSLATMLTINSSNEDMMYILDLSYKNLPRHLKACFLYLGCYQEDYEIKRVDLLRRWVAEGFVNSVNGQDVWDAAESYFNELVNRSMIQPTYGNFDIKVSGCKVHDMLLELIIRKCKEDNFMSLLKDLEASSEGQDKVIRRLVNIGLRGVEDGKVAMTFPRDLSHIRSLNILQGSNWIPPLLELKFVRVLCIQTSYWCKMKIDLVGINRLSQLRYLKVCEGSPKSVVLPSQIHGLRLLETMDLSGLWNCNILFDIIDAPSLSHLVLPNNIRLFAWIGELKSLRTLRSFSPQMNSLETIISLGKLTALTDLSIYIPNTKGNWIPRMYMDALGTSLEKLGNLKQLDVCNDDDDWHANVFTSLSPSFCNLERLIISGCTLSRAPSWISHVQNLRVLWFGVRQILPEDIVIIGTRLPSLLELSLRISDVPTEKIVIEGSMGFPVVKWFQFSCDRISYLAFEVGAMPELQDLELIFEVDKWDNATPGGLQHLPILKRIIAHRVGWSRNNDMSKQLLIKGVFQEAAHTLPTRPTFTLKKDEWMKREDYIVTEEDYNILTKEWYNLRLRGETRSVRRRCYG